MFNTAVCVIFLSITCYGQLSCHNSPLQKREGTGRVSYIDQIENLNIKTEIFKNEKVPDQV